jgi:hypothetical protein
MREAHLPSAAKALPTFAGAVWSPPQPQEARLKPLKKASTVTLIVVNGLGLCLANTLAQARTSIPTPAT